ncbi:MAG: hypothetical protein Q8R44_14645 [Novosphingobium sp.]|nr:hypothetical protein [Novosphingobium sp.]
MTRDPPISTTIAEPIGHHHRALGKSEAIRHNLHHALTYRTWSTMS